MVIDIIMGMSQKVDIVGILAVLKSVRNCTILDERRIYSKEGRATEAATKILEPCMASHEIK